MSKKGSIYEFLKWAVSTVVVAGVIFQFSTMTNRIQLLESRLDSAHRRIDNGFDADRRLGERAATSQAEIRALERTIYRLEEELAQTQGLLDVRPSGRDDR